MNNNQTNSYLDLNEEETDRPNIVYPLNEPLNRSNTIPKRLNKTLYCSLTLFILGIVLVIVGIIHTIMTENFTTGIPFWAIGGIVLIPGAYYTLAFYRIRTEKNDEIKQEMIDDIPEI
jgi:hypothetical protein